MRTSKNGMKFSKYSSQVLQGDIYIYIYFLDPTSNYLLPIPILSHINCWFTIKSSRKDYRRQMDSDSMMRLSVETLAEWERKEGGKGEALNDINNEAYTRIEDKIMILYFKHPKGNQKQLIKFSYGYCLHCNNSAI